MTILSSLKHNDLKQQHENLISNSHVENAAAPIDAACTAEKRKRKCLFFLFTFIFCVSLSLVGLVLILGIISGAQYVDNLLNGQQIDQPQAEATRIDFSAVETSYTKISLNNRLPKPESDVPYSAIIKPISANFANPLILEQNSNSSSKDGLLDFYRKIEISVRLTLHELKSEMEHWQEDIFACKYLVAQICSPESIKTAVSTQLNSLNEFKQIFWHAAHSTKKINETEIYEKIIEAKQFLTEIETKQVDLCETSANTEKENCRRCIRRKADEYYTNGLRCKTFREWHVIGYKPKIVRFCT